MKTNKMRRRKAFTLIELLIVIAIIGILFIVLISKVDFATDKAKASGVQTDFRSFQMAFDTVAREQAGFKLLVDENYEQLEKAINKNLDNKLKIDIDDMGNITMANGALDPWGSEYHGKYVQGDDGKDRGALIMYSNGANLTFGSDASISEGVAIVSSINANGKDDYSIVVCYSLANGYGTIENITTGFGNKPFAGNNSVDVPSVPGGSVTPNTPDNEPEDEPENGGETGGGTGTGSGSGGTTSSFSQAAITYTWAELNEMAMENLTPEQYKTQYGLEVGMIKDEKYVLVDLDGNGYDGFIFMYDMGISMALDEHRSNTGAYPSFPTSEFIKDSFIDMPYEIRRVTKTITAKINESTASIDTVYDYKCQLILPSAREISNTVSTWEPDTIPLDREGQTFEFFALYGGEARLAISNGNDWWTRSCNYDIYSVYSVQSDNGGVGASYPTAVYELHPFFVIGRPADPEIPETTVEDYTWAQLKELGSKQLTADQYKFEYGIQVGQVKDGKYVLVDVNNNYGGFVFMFNSGETNAYSTVGTISGGYSNAYYINEINNKVLATMIESDEDGTLKDALKTVSVKHTGGYGDYWEDHTYNCKVFAPAVREVYTGLDNAVDNNRYIYICDTQYYQYVYQEGQTFEWFMVDDKTTEAEKRAAFSNGDDYWLRTTYMKNNRTDSFCQIQGNNGGVGAAMASGSNELVMCFVIG